MSFFTKIMKNLKTPEKDLQNPSISAIIVDVYDFVSAVCGMGVFVHNSQ